MVPRARDRGTRQARGPRGRRSPQRDIRERNGADHRRLCAVARLNRGRQGVAHGLDCGKPSPRPRVEHARRRREIQSAALLPRGFRNSDHDARRRGHRPRDARPVRPLDRDSVRRGPRRDEPGHRRDPAPRLRVRAPLLTAKVMTLDFEIFELASLALATAVVAAVVSDGRSNWYEGALLVMVYAVIAVAFLFHPPPP